MAPLWEILTLLKKSALACVYIYIHTPSPPKIATALRGLCFGRVSVPYLRGRSISFNSPFSGDRSTSSSFVWSFCGHGGHDFPEKFFRAMKFRGGWLVIFHKPCISPTRFKSLKMTTRLPISAPVKRRCRNR